MSPVKARNSMRRRTSPTKIAACDVTISANEEAIVIARIVSGMRLSLVSTSNCRNAEQASIAGIRCSDYLEVRLYW